jgi:hypothetical protein
MDVLQAGDVLVIANGGWTGSSVVSDLIAGMFKNIGVAAIVTDGAVRDVAGLEQVGLPVFARGLTANSPQKNGPGSVGLEVGIGGLSFDPVILSLAIGTASWSFPRKKFRRPLMACRQSVKRNEKSKRVLRRGLQNPIGSKNFLPAIA